MSFESWSIEIDCFPFLVFFLLFSFEIDSADIWECIDLVVLASMDIKIVLMDHTHMIASRKDHFAFDSHFPPDSVFFLHFLLVLHFHSGGQFLHSFLFIYLSIVYSIYSIHNHVAETDSYWFPSRLDQKTDPEHPLDQSEDTKRNRKRDRFSGLIQWSS